MHSLPESYTTDANTAIPDSGTIFEPSNLPECLSRVGPDSNISQSGLRKNFSEVMFLNHGCSTNTKEQHIGFKGPQNEPKSLVYLASKSSACSCTALSTLLCIFLFIVTTSPKIHACQPNS